MAIKYDTEELGKTLDKLDAALSKAEPEKEETSADLVKSLADVAKGAIELASERKDKRSKKKDKETASTLAKAAKDDDDDDKDDDDDHMPQWLRDKTDDGKAAGEMQFAGDRDDYPHGQMTNAGGESRQMGKNIGHMGKSVQIGDMEVVDVGEYLDAQAQRQTNLGKSMLRLERLHKSVINGLIEIESRIQALEALHEEQARFSAVCAKALGFMIEQRETYMAQPNGTSRYAGMEKSIALAQRQIDQEGGSVFKTSGPGTEHNREMLAKAVQTGKISPEQMTYIKRTERLPAGITLN